MSRNLPSMKSVIDSLAWHHNKAIDDGIQIPKEMKNLLYTAIEIVNTEEEQQKSIPVINAEFYCIENGITGTTDAPVKKVYLNDDGSITVRIDYWPPKPSKILIFLNNLKNFFKVEII